MSAPTQQDDTAQKVAQSRDLIVQLRQGIAQISQGVRSAVQDVPLVGEAAVSAIDAASADINRTLDEIQGYTEAPGSPTDLEAVGEFWAGQVQPVISAINGDLSLDKLAADDVWKGLAATAYRTAIPAQGVAAENIRAACPDLNTAFKDLASAVRIFWTAIVVALLAMVAAVVVVVATIASGGTTSLGAAAAILAAVATFVGAMLVATMTMSGSTKSTEAVLQNRLGNNTGLPEGGTWPRSTRVSSDATFSDGSSDWQLREYPGGRPPRASRAAALVLLHAALGITAAVRRAPCQRSSPGSSSRPPYWHTQRQPSTS